MFDDNVLLVTGRTGSFGNVVLRRFLQANVREVRVFSRDEKKQDGQRRLFGNRKSRSYIGDVRDHVAIVNASRNVDYVFHAAALKRVPSYEFYPVEAVRTNVLGTDNVLVAAIVKRVLQAIEVLKQQPRGDRRLLGLVGDYAVPNVSDKVLRVILSYTDYVRRAVWHQF